MKTISKSHSIEKARELVNRFMFAPDTKLIDAKQCALLCVDELIDDRRKSNMDSVYWERIKQEIKKL